jgi:hypothetical protein
MQAFFQQKRGACLAQKYHSLFESSLDTGTAAGEMELPPAMVAMAAVAVSLLLLSNAVLMAPTRSMHHWMRRSQVWNLMLILMKIHTTPLFLSWSRFGTRNC